MLILSKNGLFCLYNLYCRILILAIRTFTKKCVTLQKNNIFQFCKKWCILERQGYHIRPTWFFGRQKCRTPPPRLKPNISNQNSINHSLSCNKFYFKTGIGFSTIQIFIFELTSQKTSKIQTFSANVIKPPIYGR